MMSQWHPKMSQFVSLIAAQNVAIPAMNRTDSNASLRGALIDEVVLVDRICRVEPGDFKSQSLPGHLIHVVTEGEVEQRAGGVMQHYGAGQAIWYCEDEPVYGRALKVPWVFYTVNFLAPALPPPPLDQRVCTVEPQTVARMEQLFDTWRNADMPPLLRHVRVHALLLQCIADLLPADSQRHRVDTFTQLWWEIELHVRRNPDAPIDLKYLRRITGQSQRSIVRACHLAVGLSPMKRVKQIRLSYARGLVQLSNLTMTEIALRVGYSRVQEFSRDYREHYGRTPTDDRRAGPNYRECETLDQETGHDPA
jgi:AraC-like DNA-binding protein